MRAFYVDEYGDLDWTDSVTDAASSAASCLSLASDDAAGAEGWPGLTGGISWGITISHVVEIDSGFRRCERCGSYEADHYDEHCDGGPDWQRCVDYQLQDAPGLAEALVEILAARPELAAEVVDRLRTATGGPLPPAGCAGGMR